jgi:ribonucleoside-diphosphate reductase alpha chain
VYVTVGLYPDGSPGELYIHADKVGSLAHGALAVAAVAISVGLRHGIPVSAYLPQMIGSKFGPGGFTGDAAYPTTGSILDLIGRWLRDKFVPQAPPDPPVSI